jgi:GTP-binding GTPase Middle Region
MEYQLPRLTRMWSHLERQAGGRVKGMGEKQIEIDKRILKTQVSFLCQYMVSFFIFLNYCFVGKANIELIKSMRSKFCFPTNNIP